MLEPFAKYFPDLAFDECRFLFLVPNELDATIENADECLVLFEYYCAAPKCDCRRVMLEVVSDSEQRPLCSISYGFDRNESDCGPFIDPLNPRVSNAEKVLELVKSRVLCDQAYIARLKRHYQMVKDAVGGRSVVATPEQAREVIAEKRHRLKQRRHALKHK